MKTNQDKFSQWFNEQEGFHLRSERFYDDVNQIVGNSKSLQVLVDWLKAAYDQGVKDTLNKN